MIEEVAFHKEQRYNDVIEELAKTKDQPKLDSQRFWKVKKKLCPRTKDPPSVMLDSHDNLLTTDKAIEDRAIEVYKERLNNNDIKPHLSKV